MFFVRRTRIDSCFRFPFRYPAGNNTPKNITINCVRFDMHPRYSTASGGSAPALWMIAYNALVVHNVTLRQQGSEIILNVCVFTDAPFVRSALSQHAIRTYESTGRRVFFCRLINQIVIVFRVKSVKTKVNVRREKIYVCIYMYSIKKLNNTPVNESRTRK